MRELHVIAVSPDGRHVVLGATKGAKTGTHRVRLDARLVAAVRGDLRAFDAPDVDLSPKQIQARLRAGESAEDIARSAGVAITRVERFAGPVAGEMARTIEAARSGFVVRGRRGRSLSPLREAVRVALADSVSPDALTWRAYRDEDGRWRVSVSWQARGRAREAAWWYVPGSVELTAVDPGSAALGHVDAERRPTSTESSTKKAAVARAPQPAAKKAVKKAEKKADAKVPATKAVKPTVKPVVKKVAPRAVKPTVQSASKKSAPKAVRSTVQPAAKKSAPKAVKPTVQPAAKKSVKQIAKPTAKPPAAQPAARARLQVVPDSATARRRSEPKAVDRPGDKDGVKTRASVPAWADVLLGTTPGGDR